MMLHSFEMLLPINYEDVRHLFYKYGVKVDKYEHFGAAVIALNQKVKDRFTAYGIRWISSQGKGVWYLHLKVDAIKILGRSNITDNDYDVVEADIRVFLIKHFGHASYFNSHRLTRIDYRFDAVVPNPNERKLLFHLFEKYTKKYGFKEMVKWGKDENGNPIKYETSQYHKCKSVELFIYSKEDERKAKGEKIESYDRNRVRYELRLKNEHLNGMTRDDKGTGRSKKLRTYFSNALSEQYLKKHVLPIVHKGDYYKITEAEKIIENSSFSKLKKEKLRAFLISISKGNIDTPLKKGISKPTYRLYLRDLENIRVNPILIPKNRTDFPNTFKNPFEF
ncbi:phage/plasmid replication domain-containing protein [Heyndrickxia ginsengihumi]|uniref:phage/plasmid replication domain-containing protein n=1 Tax=Heyndrickxia ginsengihumi TaxID=363870 RepID=UPI003D1A8705